MGNGKKTLGDVCAESWRAGPAEFGRFVDKLRARHPGTFAQHTDVHSFLRDCLAKRGTPSALLPTFADFDEALYEYEHFYE